VTVSPRDGGATFSQSFVSLLVAELRDAHELSVRGMLTWLLEPFAMTIVYILLVAVMLDRGEPSYPLFLVCALLPWRYVQGVVTSGMDLLMVYANVITTRPVPRLVFPCVLLAAEGASFLVALTLLAPVMVATGTPPTLALVWLPVTIAALVALMVGPSMLASLFGVYFPDYRSTMASLVRLGFMASTGVVALDSIRSEWAATAVRLNPASAIFDSFRSIVVDGRLPSAWNTLYPFAVGGAVAVLGLVVFRAVVPAVAKDL